MDKLYDFVCEKCHTIQAYHHKPAKCPTCGKDRPEDWHLLMKKPQRFLKCKGCNIIHVTTRHLNRCSCGSTKFEVVKNDDYWRARGAAYHDKTGRPKRRRE